MFTVSAKILRAKEVRIPEEHCTSSSDSDLDSDAMKDIKNEHVLVREREKGKGKEEERRGKGRKEERRVEKS